MRCWTTQGKWWQLYKMLMDRYDVSSQFWVEFVDGWFLHPIIKSAGKWHTLENVCKKRNLKGITKHVLTGVSVNMLLARPSKIGLMKLMHKALKHSQSLFSVMPHYQILGLNGFGNEYQILLEYHIHFSKPVKTCTWIKMYSPCLHNTIYSFLQISPGVECRSSQCSQHVGTVFTTL